LVLVVGWVMAFWLFLLLVVVVGVAAGGWVGLSAVCLVGLGCLLGFVLCWLVWLFAVLVGWFG